MDGTNKPEKDTASESPAKLLRYRAEAALVLGLMGLFRRMPIDLASAIPGKLLRLIGPFTGRHKRALSNLARIFPEMPMPERRNIALSHWENMGRIMGELPHLKDIANDPARFSVEGEALFRAASKNTHEQKTRLFY